MRSHALLLAGLLVASSTAWAAAPPVRGTGIPLNVPDPSTSTIPTRLVVCPEGDLSGEFIFRDFARQPVSGAIVVMLFTNCATFVHCAHPLPNGVNLIVDDTQKRITGTADQDGRLVFRVKMTGSCLDANDNHLPIQVFADGVPMGGPLLMSPDQNGDLVVDAADETILNAKMGFAPKDVGTADMNGDGVVDAGDLAILQTHLTHLCDDSTPVRRSRWGQLKLLYR